MLVGMLGPFEVRTDDGVLADLPGARLRALLVALALDPGRVVPKTTLIDWIWGENPPADAANALQRLASRLRKVLPAGAVEGQTGGYRLAVAPDDVDASRFEHLLAKARQAEGPKRLALLREATKLWRGAAMQDVGLEDSEAFAAAVTRLEGLRLTAMEERYEAEVSQGNGTDVLTELTDAVAAHPLRERLVAAKMRALVAAGNNSEALRTYEKTREALADELGADPSQELAELHLKLLRGELSKPRRAETKRTNVRAELTTFVGRDEDVAAVKQLVEKHRLTTLIGPGGSGKTRLARETARTMVDDLPDGVWLVELAASAASAGGNEVAQAALSGLGLREAFLGEAPTADPIEGFIAAIRDREVLLILDNCEHVIEAAAAFADRVLGECRRLRIMATSREPLGITGEALWHVEPLATQTGVQLLRDRASAVRTDLGTDDATVATMVRICRALDGMPLAIELAAARLRTMTLEQLANRLDDRFRLLTGGSRTAEQRHRTLRAVVDWSWELLTDAERTVLRRLSVFSGGASLEAAEKVCAADAEDVLELLTSLAEKSLLVTVDDGDQQRFRMLTTIKEYAADRLEEAQEQDRLRQAHIAYFTELAETAEPHLRRAEQLEWVAKLKADHDNLSAAMRAAIAAGDAEAAMRLTAAAGWYWWVSGRRAEGIDLIIAAANLPGEVPNEIRAMTYGMVVFFVTSGRGDEHLGAEWIHKAYELYQRGGHTNPMLELVVPLETLLRDPGSASSAFEALLDSKDPWVRALARMQSGKMRIVLGHGGPEAEALLEQAVAEFRAIGERFGISTALSMLASQLAVRGEFGRACEYLEQATAVVTEVGAVEDVIELRTQQAVLYLLNGDEERSAEAMADAVRSADGVTWPYALVDLALASATLARLRGDKEEARHQLGRATMHLGDVAERAYVRAQIHDTLGYLADDLRESRTHRVAAWQAASEAEAPQVVAQIMVGTADLAVRLDQYEQAARLLAAGIQARGTPDRTNPDETRLEQDVRRHLGEERFAEVTRESTGTSWSDLIEATLAT
ncbi:BTAD domain-containing putative transcriptional regulator [Tenggerimyces flavus]|uniref:BTAD domain-containing putative transcriptional regulator n=1 Tax=Tenggerimyces flavus TaxID=1708749 RepID=A0ABV7YLZ3_9ACTN|nr:BTAD domain-containing putative transcriptional regulator [Tenggerimyces flavus]MBM7789518.1 putative ATPase [Tenggerimyces flavus]